MENDVNQTKKAKRSRLVSLEEKWEKTSLPNKLLIIFTAVIAGANIIYLCFNLWQMIILQGQMYQMKTSTHLDQRAWVSVSYVKNEKIEPNKQVKGNMKFKNTGRTPAYIKKMAYVIILKPQDFDVEVFANNLEETGWKTDETIKKCIAPNAAINWEFSTRKVLLSEENIESIISGKERLFVIVLIEYFDIFGEEHQTKFCGTINPENKEIAIYNKYNYMD